jgi:hypothetical protein
MIGDPHPRYPTLHVCAEDENGTATAYAPTIWFDWDDPRIVLIRNQTGQVLKHHPNYSGEFGGISGTSNLQAADKEIQSD